MTSYEIETAVFEALGRIAPDIEVTDIDRDCDLREEFDLDSMDFLKLIAVLGKRFNVPMPESDYSRMLSVNGLCQYLDAVTEG